MPSVYQLLFGGSLVAPAIPTYLSLSMSTNQVLGWPLESNITSPAAAEIIDVSATAGGLTIQLSDARSVGTGYCALFNNVGANTFTLLDAQGNTLMAPAPGAAWQIYLADNSTLQGTWRVFQYGASVSTANAATLAGAGLKAISTTLNEQITFSPQAASYTIGSGTNQDRAACIEWTGGAGGTFSSSAAATLGAGWFCYIKNSGTGVVSFVPGSGQINGSASMTFNPNDSAIIATDGTNFFSIGFGQSVASSFNFVTISLAGDTGNVVLTGAQLNRISYRFTGALAGNTVVIVPASIQQYWIDNETTGAFTLTISAGGAGSTFVVPQANRVILYCDGLNIVSAITGGGVTFGNGTAASPSITFASDGTTGLYLPGAGVLGFAAGGRAAGSVNASGQWSLPAATTGTTLAVAAASGATTLALTATTGAAGPLSFGWSEGIDTNTWNIFSQSTDPLVIGTGSGTLSLATSATNRLVIASTGATTLNAASGTSTTLTVTGATGNATSLVINSSQGATNTAGDIVVNRAGSTANAVAEGPNLELWDTSATTVTNLQQSGGQTELWQFNGSWAQIFKVATTRAVTINAPASGNSLTVTGPANSRAAYLVGNATAGQSFGLLIQAGTNTSDDALRVQNQAGTVNYFVVQGGGVVFGNDGTNLFELGYKDVPLSTQNVNYTLQLSDRGKTVQAGSSVTYTVPSSVFGQGAVVTLRVTSGSTLTVAQGSGMTLSWAGNGGTTGNRTMTGESIATLLFTSAGSCSIAGAGVT